MESEEMESISQEFKHKKFKTNLSEMTNTYILTVQDFKEYFDKNLLGKLYLPNGTTFDNLRDVSLVFEEQEGGNPLNVNLGDLYNLINKWKIKGKQVPFEDITAIIAYGSAVKSPGYKIEEVDNEMIEVPIKPNDADFFVLTNRNMVNKDYIKTGFLSNWSVSKHKRHKRVWVPNPYDPSSADITAEISRSGINLVNRGVNQLLEGIVNGDTISISALKEGIPVFYDEKRMNEIYDKSGIKKETPRKLYWGEFTLNGRII